MSESEEEKENQKPSEAPEEQPPGQFDPAQDPEYLSWLESTAPHEYTNDYCGLNPDEFEDHQDILAMMRMDVQGYDECHFVCDDETLFADIASKEYRVRKTTNKKWKRICGMEQALEDEDFLHRRVLQGQLSKIPRQPHFGRCWIKQLFAGQMGLTLLAALIGMACGVPLDYNISGWDATTSLGKKQLHHDMMREDPDLTVITHPCGPWGNWSRFNLAKSGPAQETVEHLREENRSLPRSVNKTVKDRVRAMRHVFLEHPLGSQSLDEPEMKDVKAMVDNGTLFYIIVDGGQVGYKDAESGLPNKKPSHYITSMVAAESVFADCRCDGSHEHEHLEGRNTYGSKTAQASVWPHQLNEMVLTTIMHQREIEVNAVKNTHEAFPSEARRLRPRKRGPQAVLVDQYSS